MSKYETKSGMCSGEKLTGMTWQKLRFQATLEGSECLRRCDAGWQSVPCTRHSDEEHAVTNRRTAQRWCDNDEDRSLLIIK